MTNRKPNRSDHAEAFPPDEAMAGAFDGMTYGEYSPAEATKILDSLPEGQTLEQTNVVTSVRLPYPLAMALKAYAEERGESMSTLIRQWVELHVMAADRPISLQDAVRLLSSLPPAA